MGFAPFPVERHSEVVAAWQRHKNLQRVAREVGCHHQTVSKILNRNGINPEIERAQALLDKGKREPTLQVQPTTPIAKQSLTAFLPDPAPEAGGPILPDPVEIVWEDFVIESPGHVAVLSDAHIPYHDKRTIELWIKESRQRQVTTIFLNGDILDCGEFSDHYREPNDTRFELEQEVGEAFIAYLRANFPRARIFWKLGNHEERLPRYLANNAPALWGNKALSIQSLLNLSNYGVELIEDMRVVRIGKLPVIHGHEYRGGAGGVNPARTLYMKAGTSAMCGHWHRSAEHFDQVLDRKIHGCFTTGCACYLYPKWMRLNKWNHGYAFVEVEASGHYHVTNRKILRDGRVA